MRELRNRVIDILKKESLVQHEGTLIKEKYSRKSKSLPFSFSFFF